MIQHNLNLELFALFVFKAYRDLMGFILAMNSAVKGKKAFTEKTLSPVSVVQFTTSDKLRGLHTCMLLFNYVFENIYNNLYFQQVSLKLLLTL